MGFFKYPYTDLNELNLDWVIAKIKYIEQAKNIIYDNSGTALISNNVQDAIDEIYNLISTQGVTSFNARTGAVVPEAGDYTASQVTYDNTNTGYTATDVQAAIDEADAKIEAVSQTVPVTYVETFNSRSGVVAPAAGDYNGTQVTYDNTQSGLTATDLQAAVDELAAAPGGVTSFNNRTGAVVPAASDYDAAQVDFDDTIAQTGSSNVQGALQYVATRGSSAALTTYDNTQSGLTATNVQAAIDEVANDVLSSGVASFNGRTGAVNPQSGDYDGSEVTYDNTVSGLTATDVQSAIDEIAGQTGGVSSFNGRTGAVVPAIGDYDLTELGDVAISSPANDEVLKYDSVSQKWVNGAGGGGSSTLGGLSDVTLTSPTNGQALVYDSNSGEWKNATVGGGGNVPSGSALVIGQYVAGYTSNNETIGALLNKTALAVMTQLASLGNDEYLQVKYIDLGGNTYVPTRCGKRYTNTDTVFYIRCFDCGVASSTEIRMVQIHSTLASCIRRDCTLNSVSNTITFADVTNNTTSASCSIYFDKYKIV